MTTLQIAVCVSHAPTFTQALAVWHQTINKILSSLAERLEICRVSIQNGQDNVNGQNISKITTSIICEMAQNQPQRHDIKLALCIQKGSTNRDQEAVKNQAEMIKHTIRSQGGTITFEKIESLCDETGIEYSAILILHRRC